MDEYANSTQNVRLRHVLVFKSLPRRSVISTTAGVKHLSLVKIVVGWLVGRRSVAWLVGWLVACLLGCLVGWSTSYLS